MTTNELTPEVLEIALSRFGDDASWADVPADQHRRQSVGGEMYVVIDDSRVLCVTLGY